MAFWRSAALNCFFIGGFFPAPSPPLGAAGAGAGAGAGADAESSFEAKGLPLPPPAPPLALPTPAEALSSPVSELLFFSVFDFTFLIFFVLLPVPVFFPGTVGSDAASEGTEEDAKGLEGAEAVVVDTSAAAACCCFVDFTDFADLVEEDASSVS